MKSVFFKCLVMTAFSDESLFLRLTFTLLTERGDAAEVSGQREQDSKVNGAAQKPHLTNKHSTTKVGRNQVCTYKHTSTLEI